MRLLQNQSSLLVIDMQEKFTPHITGYEQVLHNCKILVQSFQLLEIPISYSEQNSKKLGSTVDELKNLMDPSNIHFEKIEFSCFDNISYQNILKTYNSKIVVLCGIEAHICVLQTAIDLKEKGYQPVVVWDAISSRKLENKNLALERIKQEEILISSTESILFELMRSFEHKNSRLISKLIK